MYKRFPLFLILFFSIPQKSLCQAIDSVFLRLSYSFSYTPDSLNVNVKKKDSLIVEIGENTSKCFSYHRNLFESSLVKEIENNSNLSSYKIDVRKYNITGMTQKVYRNYPENKITVTDIIVADKYLYIDSMALFNWQIQKDTATILGFLCQKAVSFFRGRNYLTWFTYAIPISSGPLKFGGLPGLILLLQDEKNNFEFECKSIQPLKQKEPMYLDEVNCIKITRNEYRKLILLKVTDPIAFAKANNVQFTMNNGEQIVVPKRKYNPIELE